MPRLPATRTDLRRRRGLLAASALLWAPRSQALEAARGKVVLSVTGLIDRSNTAQGVDFDMAMLESLPQHGFTTATPWFKAPRRFSGPLLRELLATVGAGAAARMLYAVALNNYKVEIPIDDASRYAVLLATRLDGEPMSVRDKGPLFIVYPFDDSSELRSERYYSRSAWQLRRLEVR